MKVIIKTKEQMENDPQIRKDRNDFVHITGIMFTEVMFELFGETVEVDVDEDFGEMHMPDGYLIENWMIKEK